MNESIVFYFIITIFSAGIPMKERHLFVGSDISYEKVVLSNVLGRPLENAVEYFIIYPDDSTRIYVDTNRNVRHLKTIDPLAFKGMTQIWDLKNPGYITDSLFVSDTYLQAPFSCQEVKIIARGNPKSSFHVEGTKIEINIDICHIDSTTHSNKITSSLQRALPFEENKAVLSSVSKGFLLNYSSEHYLLRSNEKRVTGRRERKHTRVVGTLTLDESKFDLERILSKSLKNVESESFFFWAF
jgi:hypothetical protein